MRAGTWPPTEKAPLESVPYCCDGRVSHDISLKQRKQFEHDNKLKCEQALLNTYNDIVENGYNISML